MGGRPKANAASKRHRRREGMPMANLKEAQGRLSERTPASKRVPLQPAASASATPRTACRASSRSKAVECGACLVAEITSRNADFFSAVA